MDRTEEAVAEGRRSRGATAFDLLVVALAVAGFAPVVGNLAEAWRSTDYLAYGVAVAPVSLWLAWWRRAALKRLPVERNLLGVPALLVALALARVPLLFVQGTGLVLGVWASVWLLRGNAWIRELAFPLAYLAFVIPPPDTAIAALTHRLRLLVTEVALGILHLFELPVAREGSVIVLPNETLFVADACSGISSVFTLLPAAVLMGRFTQGGWLGRLALVIGVVPIAMFWNLVRVLGTVLGSLRYGADTVVGAVHEPAGLLTFSLGCATLLAFDVAVGRLRRAKTPV